MQHELEVAKKDCEDMIKVMQEWERKVSAYAAQEKQWDRETQAARDEVRLYLVFVGGFGCSTAGCLSFGPIKKYLMFL